jgi:hypothetical protein
MRGSRATTTIQRAVGDRPKSPALGSQFGTAHRPEKVGIRIDRHRESVTKDEPQLFVMRVVDKTNAQ